MRHGVCLEERSLIVNRSIVVDILRPSGFSVMVRENEVFKNLTQLSLIMLYARIERSADIRIRILLLRQ